MGVLSGVRWLPPPPGCVKPVVTTSALAWADAYNTHNIHALTYDTYSTYRYIHIHTIHAIHSIHAIHTDTYRYTHMLMIHAHTYIIHATYMLYIQIHTHIYTSLKVPERSQGLNKVHETLYICMYVYVLHVCNVIHADT